MFLKNDWLIRFLIFWAHPLVRLVLFQSNPIGSLKTHQPNTRGLQKPMIGSPVINGGMSLPPIFLSWLTLTHLCPLCIWCSLNSWTSGCHILSFANPSKTMRGLEVFPGHTLLSICIHIYIYMIYIYIHFSWMDYPSNREPGHPCVFCCINGTSYLPWSPLLHLVERVTSAQHWPKLNGHIVYVWRKQPFMIKMSEITSLSTKNFNLNISLAGNFYIFVMKYFEHQKLHHLWTENTGSEVHNLLKTEVCVSSQIGCKMGCRFCATGNSGKNKIRGEFVGKMSKIQISPFVRMVVVRCTKQNAHCLGLQKSDGNPANYCESTEKKQSGDWKCG